MKIRCPSCKAAYDMDESRVPAAGISIKCPKCQAAFRVNRGGVDAPAPVVPLPAPDRPVTSPALAAPVLAPPPAPPPPESPALPPLPDVALPGSADDAMKPPGWDATSHPARRSAADSAPDLRPVPLPARPGAELPPPSNPVESPTMLDLGTFDPGFDDHAQPPEQTPPQRTIDPAPTPSPFGFGAFGDVSAPRPAPSGFGAPPPESDPFADPFAQNPFALPSSGPPPRQAAPPAADDLAMLDFVDPEKAPASAATRWHVRRQSGKVFGPFEATTIAQMLKQGQLFGSEEISTDQISWKPLASEPALASAIPGGASEPPGLPVAGAPRVAPPMVPILSPDDDLVVPVEARGNESAPGEPKSKGEKKAKKPKKEKPPREKKPKKTRRPLQLPAWTQALAERWKLVAGVGALVVVLAAGLALGRFTSYGYFGAKALFRSSPHRTLPIGAQLAAFDKEAAAGTYRSWQQALTAAQTAIDRDPGSTTAAVDYVIAASLLQRRYGAAGEELKRARTLATKLGDRTLEGRLAGAALLLSRPGGELKAEALLGSLDDPRATLLAAQAKLSRREWKGAAKLLDEALQKGKTGELLLLRAEAAQGAGDEKAEEAALAGALALEPGQPRATLELADLRARQHRSGEAVALLEKVLQEPAVKELDSSEEAAGQQLWGDLAAARRDDVEAEKHFRRAIDTEPDNVRHRAALAALVLRQRRYDDAVAAYLDALKKAPSDVELLTGAGRAYIGVGDPVKAENELEAARAISPKNPAVLVALGDLQRALVKPDDAHRFYQDALAKNPGDVPALVADGSVQLAQGHTADAKKQLEKAVELAPNDGDALTALGEFELAQRDAAGARTSFEKALAGDASLPRAHAGLASALVVLGDAQKAQEEFARAVQLDPRSIDVRERYAGLLSDQGQAEAALAQLKAALQVDPKDAHLLALAGAVGLGLGKTVEAEAELKSALLLNDTDPVAHEYYGRLLAQKNQPNDAIDHLKRALELDGTRAETWYQLGLVRAGLRQLQEATDAFRKAVQLDPKRLDAEEKLGGVLAQQSLYVEAASVFRELVKAEPQKESVLESLGDCDLALDDAKDALVEFEAARAADKDAKTVHYKLGRAYDKLGQSQKAVAAYETATRVEPTNPGPHYYLGYAYKGLDRRKDAIAEFKKYLEVAGDSPEAAEIRDQIAYLQQGP